MPKYVIPYSIDGELEIEAETSTEAELKFMQIGKRELAELYGVLKQAYMHTVLVKSL